MTSSLREEHEGEGTLSLRDLLQIIRRRILIIMLVALLPMALALGFDYTQPPVYEASIKVLIGQGADADATNDLSNELEGLQQLTATMVEAIQTRPVATEAIELSGLSVDPGTFMDNLRVEQVESTQFIEISYRSTDPVQAQATANSIGEVFSNQISEVSPSASSVTATVWEQAVVPQTPVSPSLLRDALLALILGIMLGVGLAFLLDYLDDDWRSPDEAERLSGAPSLAVVPKFKVRKGR